VVLPDAHAMQDVDPWEVNSERGRERERERDVRRVREGMSKKGNQNEGVIQAYHKSDMIQSVEALCGWCECAPLIAGMFPYRMPYMALTPSQRRNHLWATGK